MGRGGGVGGDAAGKGGCARDPVVPGGLESEMTKVRGAGCGVACGLMLVAGSLSAQSIPPLPDSTGFGVHVLALARAPDSAIWVGTYGEGVFVLRPGAGTWEHLQHSTDSAARSISWDFV